MVGHNELVLDVSCTDEIYDHHRNSETGSTSQCYLIRKKDVIGTEKSY